MTETPTPYHATITAAPPAVDPAVLELFELCFHRALSPLEAAEKMTALMAQRQLDFMAGWVTLGRGDGYEVLLQEDELL